MIGKTIHVTAIQTVGGGLTKIKAVYLIRQVLYFIESKMFSV